MGYRNWTYKVKEFFRKIIAFAIVGALAYGSYSLYRDRTFRSSFRTAMHRVFAQFPSFGSKFKKWNPFRESTVSRSNGHSRGKFQKSRRSRKSRRRH